jgi:hypothetical protein
MSLRHVAAFAEILGAPFRPAPVRRYPDAELFDVEAFDRSAQACGDAYARCRTIADAIDAARLAASEPDEKEVA